MKMVPVFSAHTTVSNNSEKKCPGIFSLFFVVEASQYVVKL